MGVEPDFTVINENEQKQIVEKCLRKLGSYSSNGMKNMQAEIGRAKSSPGALDSFYVCKQTNQIKVRTTSAFKSQRELDMFTVGCDFCPKSFTSFFSVSFSLSSLFAPLSLSLSLSLSLPHTASLPHSLNFRPSFVCVCVCVCVCRSINVY